jgi:hypothetical protein
MLHLLQHGNLGMAMDLRVLQEIIGLNLLIVDLRKDQTQL